MKKKRLGLIFIIMSFVAMISCNDDDPFTPPIPEDRMLAVSDTVCMMFTSMNGSSQGGIEDVEMDIYKKRHNAWMNSIPFAFGELVKKSSITFIGETDSAKINGYINCGYNKEGFVSMARGYNVIVKYKFEDNALKVFVKDIDRWVTLGYGNKEKIDVYIETKIFYAGAMPLHPDEIIPSFEDKYVWEIQGTNSFDANISITPEQAAKLIERKNWQDYFDEIGENWKYMPAANYYSTMFKSSQDMKHKYQGATWSIYKMTYTPKIEE